MATDLQPDLVSENVVTVQGIWTGESIRNARIVDLIAPIGMPLGLGDGIDPDIVPAGRLARNEILAPAVLRLTQELSDQTLLFYCAYKAPDGWFGMACVGTGCSQAEFHTGRLTSEQSGCRSEGIPMGVRANLQLGSAG